MPVARKPFYKVLYIQVLIGIVLGVIVGLVFPDVAIQPWMKALGDGFVKLIKMVITPIIFCTVVSGIAHIADAKKVGRVAIKALVYFEIISTFALLIGVGHGQRGAPRQRFQWPPGRRKGRGVCQAGRRPRYGKVLPRYHS